mmetsp:Transcript_25126/g.74994  ORF Transcript_25126/g.74994 Transcript_25126/m.74994 type:complete len:342 (+) Transcript_25126:601-1626(+)
MTDLKRIGGLPCTGSRALDVSVSASAPGLPPRKGAGGLCAPADLVEPCRLDPCSMEPDCPGAWPACLAANVAMEPSGRTRRGDSGVDSANLTSSLASGLSMKIAAPEDGSCISSSSVSCSSPLRPVHVFSSLLMMRCTRGIRLSIAFSFPTPPLCSTSTSRHNRATSDSRHSWLCPHTLSPSTSEATATLLALTSTSSFTLSSSMRLYANALSAVKLDSQDRSADSSPAFKALICCCRLLPSPNIAPVRTPSRDSNSSHRLESRASMESNRSWSQDSNGVPSTRPGFTSSEGVCFEKSSVIAGVAAVRFSSLVFEGLEAGLAAGLGTLIPGANPSAVGRLP